SALGNSTSGVRIRRRLNEWTVRERVRRFTVDERISFVWLEITGKCQLECTHCYAESGPSGDHGVMQLHDWQRAIDQAAEFGAEMAQFIGGEPTRHPELPTLINHALGRGVEVEVFTNMVSIHPV